ncbi:hypothetical protein AAHA92_00722 [Salvia divinorum]|uniref:DUF8040 domain-containing protein n=1 Tax=Salvia divinorum TaxID=28513 RepID=A0ABD1IPT1_SALDI
MDFNAFGRLFRILRDRCGLVDQRYVRVEEQVAMFLTTLAHHKKTRIVGFDFIRSRHTVSHYVYEVMRCVIHLHSTLFVEPSPVGESYSGNNGAVSGQQRVNDEHAGVQYVDSVESSPAWNQKRLDIAHHMWRNL